MNSNLSFITKKTELLVKFILLLGVLYGGTIFIVYFSKIGYLPSVNTNEALPYIFAATVTGITIVGGIVFSIYLAGSIMKPEKKNIMLGGEKNIERHFMRWYAAPIFFSTSACCMLMILTKFESVTSVTYLIVVGLIVISVPTLSLIQFKKRRYVRSGWDYFSTLFYANFKNFFFIGIALPLIIGVSDPINIALSVLIVQLVALNYQCKIFVGEKKSDFSGLVLIFLILGFTVYGVSEITMRVFGFGNLKHVSIELSEEGYHALSSAKILIQKGDSNWILHDVNILSMIGNEYYLKINREGAKPLKIQIPKKDVLAKFNE